MTVVPIKLQKSEILEINVALGELAKLARGPRLAYALAKDLGKLQPEIRAIDKAKEPSAEFQKLDATRAELAAKHAKKDEHGEPVIGAALQNGVPLPGAFVYQIEDQAAFEAAVVQLKADNAEVIAAREQQMADWRQMLKEDTVVELHQIPLALVEVDPGVAAGKEGVLPLAEILRPLIGTVITEE